MIAVPTHSTSKGLLIRPVGSIHIRAAAARLRGVGSFDGVGGYPPLGGGPGDLLWNVRQIGSIEIGIHGASFKAHGGDREILVDDASIGVILDHLIHSPVHI